MRRTLLLATTCLIGGLGGCASTPSRGSDVQMAVDRYEAGRYDECYHEAMDLLKTESGDDRAAAAYLAGLSAYRLDRREEAELRLRTAAEGGDREVTARAQAMLGVIRLEQGRYQDARGLLRDASPGLDESDAREATRLADSAAGGPVVETEWMATSLQTSSTPRHATSSGDGACFALQAGAFREEDRAQTVARELTGVLRNRMADPVQIIATKDSWGRSLHLVHFGAFTTRQEAASFRRQLGRPHYIVTPNRENSTESVVRIR
jgi:tetratricopeptide (TPR) repeat protein